jgi:hypothetical protein
VGLKSKREEEASAEDVKKSSNPCPKYRNAVHKWAALISSVSLALSVVSQLSTDNNLFPLKPGVCGHEWCYSCLELYRRNEYGLVFCRQNQDCPGWATFADIIDQIESPVRFGMRVVSRDISDRCDSTDWIGSIGSTLSGYWITMTMALTESPT